MEHVDEVRVFDEIKERRTHTLTETLSTNLIFVCLPTPQKKDSLECDVSVVEGFFHFVQTSILGPILEGGWCSRNFVLRSTVPIGTTRALSRKYGLSNLVHSPEFLTARCSVTDAHLPARHVVGVNSEPKNFTHQGTGEVRSFFPTDGCAEILCRLYEDRFPGVPIRVMSSGESEAVKLFTNGFFATKIAYFNEVRTLADELGLNWGRVMEGVLSDGRIAHSHTKVPGPDGKFGFGGECLTKDLASLKYQLLNNGCGLGVVDAVHERNKGDRKR